MEACPDSQWRLIGALARFGGLRCPSEPLALTWQDVDWERERLTVHSPKTKRYGKAKRSVPLFPDLRPFLNHRARFLDSTPAAQSSRGASERLARPIIAHGDLEAAFDDAEPGTTHVITSIRSASKNLRTRFERIFLRAGCEPWPKLSQNLRSSRQTELEDLFPSHVVCAWMGNSANVARRHYLQVTELQVTEDHFAEAIEATSQGGALHKALQTPPSQGVAPRRTPFKTP